MQHTSLCTVHNNLKELSSSITFRARAVHLLMHGLESIRNVTMLITISGGNNQLEKVCMILNKPFEMIISDNMFSSYCLLNPLTKQTTKMDHIILIQRNVKESSMKE